MITSFSWVPDHMAVESRYSGGTRLLAALGLGSLLTVVVMVSEFAVLSRLTGSGPSALPVRDIVFMVGFALIPLALAPRLLRGAERIELRGRDFVHQRYIGPLRISRNMYNVLEMKGLKPLGPVGPQLTTQTGLACWYRSGPIWFGDTLAPDEHDRVIEAMLRHDRHLRESLGMDADLGLADVGYWERPEAREAFLKELYTDVRYL